jgi:oleate hydratase
MKSRQQPRVGKAYIAGGGIAGPRILGDRPQVITEGATNFAFLGQFVEIPNDCVFTVEYSVRTAQSAVFGLFGVARE